MRKIIIITASLAMLATLSGSASAQTGTSPQCTHPAIVQDGFVQLTCFPDVPHRVFPSGKKCVNESYWAKGTKHVTVAGKRYAVTQAIRETIRICPVR